MADDLTRLFAKHEATLTYNLEARSTRALVTTAIGKRYLSDWFTFSAASWLNYAKRHGLAIVVVTNDLIDPSDPHWKNGAWQKMLAPAYVAKQFPHIVEVCVMDTDILISPRAPNIFDQRASGTFGVVSQHKNLPFPEMEVRRRIAWNRRAFYSETYPLDSSLFATPQQIFRAHGFEPHDDYFCSGLFLAECALHGEQIRSWFYEIDKAAVETSHAWEEPLLNARILSSKNVSFLPYGFQALWIFEIAWSYPFLYELGRDPAHQGLVQRCIESNLLNNHFLHFAGAWHESQMWRTPDVFKNPDRKRLLDGFLAYLQQPVTGEAKGKIVPDG
jgi:hypothetical protein